MTFESDVLRAAHAELDECRCSRLGAGAFGEVFSVKLEGGSTSVALKVEKDPEYQLKHEYQIYMSILSRISEEQAVYFPFPVAYFEALHDRRLAMLQCDCTLNSLDSSAGKVANMFNGLISALEALQIAGVLHYDIKPENIGIRYLHGEASPVLLDFGLARSIYDSHKRREVYVKRRRQVPFTGTWRYASLNVHRGNGHWFGDDIVSLIYSFLEVSLREVLPWSGNAKDDSGFKYVSAPDCPLIHSCMSTCRGETIDYQNPPKRVPVPEVKIHCNLSKLDPKSPEFAWILAALAARLKKTLRAAPGAEVSYKDFLLEHPGSAP